MNLISSCLLLVAMTCAIGGAMLWGNDLRFFAVALWFITADTTFFAFVIHAKMKRRPAAGSSLPKE